MIENITPCEKLCFMILDQQQRLEDQMIKLTDFVERYDRWTVYNVFIHTLQCSRMDSSNFIPGMYQVESVVDGILCKLPSNRSREMLGILFERFAGHIDIFFEEKEFTNKKKYLCVRGHSFNFNRLREVLTDNLQYNECIHYIALHRLPANLWKLLTSDEVHVYRNSYT